MKGNVFLGLALILTALVFSCSPKAENASQQESPQDTILSSEKTASEKKEYQAQVVVIGMGEESLKVADSAIKHGCQSVMILGNGQMVTDGTISAHPHLTFLPTGLAQSILMTTDGAIRGVNGLHEKLPMTIRCNTVILADNPQKPEVASMVAFLSKDEGGNLHVDSEGQLLRQATVSQAPPTKCGVPLTSAPKGEPSSELIPVTGFYALAPALGNNALTPSPDDLGKLIAAKQNTAASPSISPNN